jgi:anthranilate phosphoribosyltransferase
MTAADPEAIKPLLRDLGQGPTRGRSLSREEARACLDLILDGRATPAQAGAFLLLQRYKGETPDELLGFVDAIRERPATRLLRIDKEGLVDIGSPYDGRLRHVIVSPAAAVLASACGVPVLMHGEPGIAPKHGLTVAHVLEAIGVPTDAPADVVEETIEGFGIGYLRQKHFAPDLASIAWLRDEIALRSPLNMVEKMYDPAGAPFHLIGLTHVPYLEKLGGALAGMGFRKTALVQGMEGNEDMPTGRGVRVIEFTVGDGEVAQREYRLDARELGLTPATQEDLAMGDGPDTSARLTCSVLDGDAPAAWRDLVLFNAAFRIYLAGRAADTEAGLTLARAALEDGTARALLDRWRAAG